MRLVAPGTCPGLPVRGRGKTIHLIDCYIAVIAEENGCAVFTLNEHFREIAKVLPLRLL